MPGGWKGQGDSTGTHSYRRRQSGQRRELGDAKGHRGWAGEAAGPCLLPRLHTPPAHRPVCCLRAGEGQAGPLAPHRLAPAPCLAQRAAPEWWHKRHPLNPAVHCPLGSPGSSPPFESFLPFCPLRSPAPILTHSPTFHSLFFCKDVTYMRSSPTWKGRCGFTHMHAQGTVTRVRVGERAGRDHREMPEILRRNLRRPVPTAQDQGPQDIPRDRGRQTGLRWGPRDLVQK